MEIAKIQPTYKHGVLYTRDETGRVVGLVMVAHREIGRVYKQGNVWVGTTHEDGTQFVADEPNSAAGQVFHHWRYDK